MRHQLILTYIDAVVRAGSIRKAADRLAITASALNRRIQDFEQELGTPIFERLARGVRLNAAGELVIRHARNQRADLEKVRSQIADLSGVRRGHVSIACSQTIAHGFLPEEISGYRREFPEVTFSVTVSDHVGAQAAMADFSVDLILVFEPSIQTELQVLYFLEEPLYAIAARGHPALAAPVVRLRDCLDYPLALPDLSFGGRRLIEAAAARLMRPIQPVVESNFFELLRRYVLEEGAITFQTLTGSSSITSEGLDVCPIDTRDVAPGRLVLGQLRGRILPVASAKFADRLAQRLDKKRALFVTE